MFSGVQVVGEFPYILMGKSYNDAHATSERGCMTFQPRPEVAERGCMIQKKTRQNDDVEKLIKRRRNNNNYYLL